DEAMVDDVVNGQLTTGRPLWVRLEARPGTNDLLLVYEDDNDDLAAVVWNGAAWESSMLLTTAVAGHQSPVFDVAFERLTGRALAAWADASVPGSLRYRLWNAGWGPAATTASMSADPITVLRLAGDHGSNQIAAGVGTGAAGLEAMVWSGSGWSVASPLTSSLARSGDGRAFDLAWEGVSGELAAVYGTATAPRGVFRVWSSSAWSGESAVPVPTGGSASGTPAWIELAGARGEDQFAFSLLDIAGRITLARWNGSAWSGVVEAEGTGSGILSGVAGRAVAVSLAQHLAGPAPGITPPPSTTETTPPATPVLTAGTVSSTSADLSWTAVGDNGATEGGRVALYELRRTLGAEVSISTITPTQDPGGTENYTVLNLFGGKTYLFDVRAVDAAGNASLWSNRVSVATPAVPPPAITDLGVVPESIYRTSVTIRWTRPAWDPDGAGLAYYIVKYKTGGTFASEQEFDGYQPEIRSTGETVTIDGLTFDTAYWFAVKAVDLAGNRSGLSNALPVTTIDHAPAAVTDLRSIGSPTTNSITLRWTMPADDSGPIASYIVKYTKLTTVGAITSNAEFDLGPPDVNTAPNQPVRDTALQPYVETLVVSGLDSNTTYWFSVKAVDAGGKRGPLSNSPQAATSAPAPDTTAPTPIPNLTVVSTATTSRSLLVSWTATGDDGSVGKATQYDVRYARFELNAANFTQGTAISAPLPSAAGAAEQLTLPALISNTQYFVGIKAIDEAGNASLSNIAVGLTGLRRGYTLVSVPLLLTAPNDDVLSVFGDDVGSTLSLYRWRSQGRNFDQGCYDGFPSPYSPYPGFSCGTIQTIAPGRGYFLYNAEESTGGRAVLDAVGTAITTMTAEVPLSEGFNMVANPYQRDIHLRDVRFKNLVVGSEMSYQQAVDAGWVAPALLLFDGVVTRAYDVTDLEAVFKPWNGGWIQSFSSDVILVFTRP
ncbi:MAG: fibronectin type III domain-containing protein, partial [Nitrospiria bacterium]